MVVTGVDHWFQSAENPDTPAVTVTGGLVDNPNQKLVDRRVNEPGAPGSMAAQFPLLEAVDFAPHP